MIKIRIKESEQECIIDISGHADYAPIGQDIVCSAISVLFQTMVYVVDDDSGSSIVYLNFDSKEKKVSFLKLDDIARNAIHFFIKGCIEVSKLYPSNVKVNIVK